MQPAMIFVPSTLIFLIFSLIFPPSLPLFPTALWINRVHKGKTSHVPFLKKD